MSPVLFHNIYKGALGEVCGEFILSRERGMKLKPINDPDRFEFFDFELNDGIYVDFKTGSLLTCRTEKALLKEYGKA